MEQVGQLRVVLHCLRGILVDHHGAVPMSAIR
jgi:hypothetical protein